jgi:hypothetical protein
MEMFVIVITDNNNPDPLLFNLPTDIVGPYETEAEAEQAARELFSALDRFDDFSTVRDYEIKPIRTRETAYNRNQSEMQMWARVYNRPFDPDYFPERIW